MRTNHTHLRNALCQLTMDSLPGMRAVPLNDEQRTILVDTRNELGLTQRQLAEKVGLKAITIHSIEAGKYLPSPSTLEKICKVLSLGSCVVVEVTLTNNDTTAASRTQSSVSRGSAVKKKPQKRK